jgi:Sec-independent protein secretion pathway component TatC
MVSQLVYGIEINDASMAQIARNLFRAHMVLCVVSPLAGSVALARYVIIQTSFRDPKGGFSQTHDFEQIRFDVVLLMKFLLDMFMPAVFTFIVREAVRHNSQVLMIGINICEAIGALLCLASMLNLLYLIPWVFTQQAEIQDEKCGGKSSRVVEDCLEDRDALSSILIAMGVALVFQLLLDTIQMFSFGTGSVYAKRARTSLREGLRFVGLSVANEFERSQSTETLKDKGYCASANLDLQPSAQCLEHFSSICLDTQSSTKDTGPTAGDAQTQHNHRLTGIQEESEPLSPFSPCPAGVASDQVDRAEV